jgi:hypothetical protein
VFSSWKMFLLPPLWPNVSGFKVIAVNGFHVVQPVLLARLPSIV